MPRFEHQARNAVPGAAAEVVFEIEREGCVVRTFTRRNGHDRKREKTHETEDAARHAYGRQIRLVRSIGYRPVGRSQQLAAPEPEPAGSVIAADEYFAAADDRFVPELLRVTAAGPVAPLAPRWYGDARPWARRALLAYIDDGCDRPGHKALVKRLFKLAEAAGDDEALAHFLVAFDGFHQRLLVPAGAEHQLVLDPEIPDRLTERGPGSTSPSFSRATRRYLARRAARYARRLGHADLARYTKLMRIALPLYRDEALATPARLLDSWSLLHALYRHAPQLARGATGFRLIAGASLGALEPAPQFPAAWRDDFAGLFALLPAARSRTVRSWLVRWLRTYHAAELGRLAYAQIAPLVGGPHEDLQQLGAELLRTASGLETLPITDWLGLLAIDNLDVLPAICELVERHVAPARLDLAQCIALACARAAPVARLGLAWARTKPITTAADLGAVLRLGRAGVTSVRDEGAAWAAALLASHPAATPEHLRDLCDAPHADVRGHALAAAATAAPALAPPALWFALTESPYPDVRDRVIRQATRWRDEAPPAALQRMWSAAVLAVHGGSRAKRSVPRDIAARLADHPDEARALLPILGLALRSVRPAERSPAIAAITRAIHRDPALRSLARELIPELEVTEQVTS